jgi:hypothetical protein
LVTYQRPKISFASFTDQLNKAFGQMDVRRLTEVVMLLANSKLDLNNKLDNDLFNHITYVSNQSLILLKKQGVNKDSLTKIGKLFWRLANVLQAYNAKKREPSIEEAIGIIEDMKAIFTGA